MKPYKKQNQKERDTPKSTKKAREEKPWIKQYQWKSEKDFNAYPKWSSWFKDNESFNKEWQNERWKIKYKSHQSVLDSIKSELRSTFKERFIAGRNWRAYNIITNEIVEFPEIENYYK